MVWVDYGGPRRCITFRERAREMKIHAFIACKCICMCVYIEREREREREKVRERERGTKISSVVFQRLSLRTAAILQYASASLESLAFAFLVLQVCWPPLFLQRFTCVHCIIFLPR